MSSKYGCEVNQWIKHGKILSMPWDCGSIHNSDASKWILEGQTYQVSWFCGETRGFYGNLMVSLWDTKISRETDIQGDGVQFPWIFSFVPCKIDLFIYFTLSINLQVFFFSKYLGFCCWSSGFWSFGAERPALFFGKLVILLLIEMEVNIMKGLYKLMVIIIIIIVFNICYVILCFSQVPKIIIYLYLDWHIS